MIRLNPEWTQLLDEYKSEHSDPRNQACHDIGIPLIVASIPAALTGIGLPIAGGMFTVGWFFQFLGHHFQQNDPAFFGDSRNLLVGVIWWLEKRGVKFDKALKSRQEKDGT